MGVLTQYLLEREDIDLKCVELDGESVDYLLTHFPGMQGRLLQADYLRLDMNRVFKGNYRIIGNFPYNISSQIFFKILDDKDRIPEVVCMIQKEVAERIAEAPGSKTYGILSVLLQAWYDIEYCFTVGSGAFAPPPKVQSAVIRLTRNARTELGCDEKLFKMVVKTAFNQRRKTLRNALKPLLTQRLQSMATIPLHPQGTGEGSPETPSVAPSGLRNPGHTAAPASATPLLTEKPSNSVRIEDKPVDLTEKPSKPVRNDEKSVVLTENEAEAPAAQQPKPKKAARHASALSLTSLMSDEEITVELATDEKADGAEALPEDDAVIAKWPELAAMYAAQPRLSNALATAKLSVRREENRIVLSFALMNEAQKNWIADKKLRELEERFQKLISCGTVRLEPGVVPEEEQEKRIYMPVEKAQDLMSKNAEVSELVKDLGLDIR